MKQKFDFKIEKLTLTESKKLIGGFSASLSGDPPLQDTTTTKVNNCNGGNYKAGCGAGSKGKKIKSVGSNANCKGNCVKGCGDTINHH
jgi:hypothetical protein